MMASSSYAEDHPTEASPVSSIMTPSTDIDTDADISAAPDASTVTNAAGATDAITNFDMTAPIFPCIEQPVRVTLHCNGYYLWGLRNGRVIARRKRSEKDEFRLVYHSGEEGKESTNENNAMVEIHNHKFGGLLSVIPSDEAGKPAKVVCVKPEEDKKKEGTATISEEDGEKSDSQEPNSSPDSGSRNTSEEEPETTISLDENTAVDTIEEAAAEDEEERLEDENIKRAIEKSHITKEDRQWCFVKAGNNRNAVLLKSLKTGENLAIDGRCNVVFASDDNADDPNLSMTWDIDCVTGELCFLSNPKLDSRLRCDMAGLLTLTRAWKGWEVFRLMEASHGYVKISSWMHSQWLLCSTADGTVSTCSHAESFLEEEKKDTEQQEGGNNNRPKRCSKWAIEKSPQGNGVIIRSKTHGRLLSVQDGVLKTYDTRNETSRTQDMDLPDIEDDSTNKNGSNRSMNAWWNSSMKNMNSSMRNSMRNMQQRLNSSGLKAEANGGDQSPKVVPQEDTLIWHLEAAHLQTYYLLNIVDGQPKSIGPFPQVTSNIRKTDKIQLIRDADGVTKLYSVEKKQYIACSSDGTISLVASSEDDSTDWIMEKPKYQSGGSIFRSMVHNFYLSYKDPEINQDELDKKDTSRAAQFNNLFNGKKDNEAKLVGSELMEEREVWRLEPCMPRAVSSEKIKIFALGTGIAVGTTIAMPFALAGVGALLGAVGAEVGIVANAIAVGLTGAEALASVGAIGATAYIVFRPEDNSLTDDHKNEEEEAAERAWSKRPFSNWRNW